MATTAGQAGFLAWPAGCPVIRESTLWRNEQGPDTVTFAPEAEWRLFERIKMQQELQTLLQRSVDLISKRALERSPNWLRRQEILDTAQPLFSEQEAIHAAG